MKKLILFSLPSEENLTKLASTIFPTEFEEKIFGYMTTNGKEESFIKYLPMWQNYAKENNAELVFIDNTKRGKEAEAEKEKLLGCNILILAGGNTFNLLNNLRESGLFETVREFVKKDKFVLAGFSAGAIIMTPTIAVAGQPAGTDPDDLMDENIPGLTDLTALNIVNFEVYPHYNSTTDMTYLENYQKQTANKVQALSDSDYLILDL